MSLKLPSVLDYGTRPSLKSNRVDRVHPEGVELAESVAQAAGTFATLYGQKKQKDSRLQYALAKNEIMALDLAQRESLKDRNDWEAFDTDYSNGFNKGRDEILGRHARLSGTDRALLSSESDLIRERGRVAAGSLARDMEIDQGRAGIERGLDEALEAIQLEAPENQTKLMLQAMETINAARDEGGWYDDTEAEALIQGFVAKSAVSALENMDKEDMIREIELSLAHRDARGPITRKKIMAGEGSNSVADFLHANDLKDMLEKGKDEHKNATQYATIYDISDDVFAEISGLKAADIDARNKLALSKLDKSDPDWGEMRTRLQAELNARTNRELNNKARAHSEAGLEVTNWVDDQVGLAAGDDDVEVPTVGTLRQMEIWQELSPDGKLQLEKYVQQRADGHEFALTNDSEFEHWWRMLSPEEKIEQLPLMDSAKFKTQLTRGQRDAWMREAEAHQTTKARPGTLKLWRGDTQDEVLRNVLVGETGLFPRSYPPSATGVMAKRYLRIDAAVNKALTEESMRRIFEGGTGEMMPEDIYKITSEIASREVMIREGAWGRMGDRRTIEAELVRVDKQTGAIQFEAAAEEAYVPIEQWRSNVSDVQHPTEDRNKTVEELLRSYSGDPAGVSDSDLEEAYFYLNALPESTGLDYARRRIRGEDGL